MITRPADERASVDPDTNGYLSDCEWLTADAAGDIVAEVERVRADEAAIAKLRMWVQHYFGDTTQGAATAKFHAGLIEKLMVEWDRWHELEVGAVRDDEDDDDEETEEDAWRVVLGSAAWTSLSPARRRRASRCSPRPARRTPTSAWHVADAAGLAASVGDRHYQPDRLGRGRLDRTWVAPAGAALAVSVLLRRLPVRPEARGWIPLAAGVAMADAVARAGCPATRSRSNGPTTCSSAGGRSAASSPRPSATRSSWEPA